MSIENIYSKEQRPQIQLFLVMLLISTFWSTWKLLCDEASFTENNSNQCFYLEQLHFSLIQNVIKTFLKISKYKRNALIFASSSL